MNYQILMERLAVEHERIERLLERFLGEPLPPLPAIGHNEPWHREYLRIVRIREALERLGGTDGQDEAPPAANATARAPTSRHRRALPSAGESAE